VALLPVVFWKRVATQANRELALLALLCAVGFLYAIKIGGDFMEFRALVAVLPALFVLVAWVAVSVVPWRVLSLVVTLLVVAASFQHARTFVARDGVESVGRLEGHIYADYRSWAQVGEVLAELFGNAEEPVVIATSAAGAIPFYSGLEAVDMHGLTDPWIARNGDVYDPPYSMLGHHKVAPFAYLVERDVNLVVGHPWVDERKPGPRPPFGSFGLARFNIYDAPLADSVPDGAVMKVLEINLDERQRLYVLYLMRSDSIDAVLAELDIRRHSVRLKRRPG
jgi:arabinofuranosyltransferase